METQLINKGQKSSVEAYEMQVSINDVTYLVSGDVTIEAGALAGINNARVINETEQTDGMPGQQVGFYMTRDGRSILTSSVDLEVADASIAAIRAFVEAIKAKFSQE